jgi:hypothetical protein
MSESRRVGDLEVAEDFDHQKRSWAVQRAGWVVLTLVVLAAAAGCFGSGPASSASAGEPGGPLHLRYDRFARAQGRTELELRVSPGPGPGSEREARVWLDRAYLAGFEIDSITPEPERTEAGPDRLVFVFALERPGPFDVTIHLQPQRFGRLRGRAGVPGGPAVTFAQLVYP